jgi:hypothetical protein
MALAPARALAAGGLSSVRVCGASAFDAKRAECARDERAAAISTGHLYCSARVGAGGSFSGRFSYEGRPFPARSGSFPGAGTRFVDVSFGGVAIPAGVWSCELRAGGERQLVKFSTAGPPGPAVGGAACRTSRTVVAATVRVCPPGSSEAAYPASGEVTCSVLVAGEAGAAARVELLYAGASTGVGVSRALPYPVATVALTISKDGGLPTGVYACRFLLAGKTVATVPFRVR